jgi:competence protein ComEA
LWSRAWCGGPSCEADIDTRTDSATETTTETPTETPAPSRFGAGLEAATGRLTRLALTAVILCAGFAGWWLWAPGPNASVADQPSPSSDVSDVTSPSADPVTASAAAGIVTLHVSGAVATPGLVEVGSGGRVADAIAAAGGALRTADLTALNLAAPVRDGEQVHVPDAPWGDGEGDGPPTGDGVPGGGGGAATTGDGLVRVNQADAVALETLPGVGPVLAERILAHRDESGPFETVEDLLDVPGIGEGRLEAIRDLVAIP